MFIEGIQMDKETKHIIERYQRMMEDMNAELEESRKEILMLQMTNRQLMESNDRLMMMAMKSDDSISLIDVSHRTYFAFSEVRMMDWLPDADKINLLKRYLLPCIEENPRIVLSCIDSIKKESEDDSSIYDDLTDWIMMTFAY